MILFDTFLYLITKILRKTDIKIYRITLKLIESDTFLYRIPPLKGECPSSINGFINEYSKKRKD